jgi:hypothetical protein
MPFGRPYIMYFVPGIYGGHNFGHHVEQEDIKMCQNFTDHLHGLIETKSRNFFDCCPLITENI